MSHLNFRLALIDGKIKIIINEVHLDDQKPSFPSDLAKYFSEYQCFSSYQSTIYYILSNLIKNSGEPGQRVTKPIQTHAISFFAQTNDNKWKPYKQTTSIFELPQTPHLALLWLAYISIAMTDDFQTTFSKSTIEDKLKGAKRYKDIPIFSMKIDTFFGEPYGYHDFKQLLIELIEFSSGLSAYQATRDAIQHFLDNYHLGQAPFAAQLRAANLDKALFKSIGHQTLNLSIPLPDRTNNLLAYAQLLIRNNNTLELNFIINNINWMAKAKIYTQCLGKQAADGGRYNLSYTEWDFFRDAEFNLLDDGRLSIDVQNNPTYIKLYATDEALKEQFKNEMIHVAKVAGLEFDPATNFEKQLIFTPACSMKLKNQGLHLNLSYMKKLLQQKIYFGLFRQAYAFQNEQNEEGMSELSASLPVEIGEQIFSAITPELDNDDINESYHQAWKMRL